MMPKIALVGTCPSSRLLAPFGDPAWEIWACGPDNAGDGGLPRVTRWFEIHGDLGVPGGEPWEKSYIEWLNKQHFALFAQRLDLFPRATLFPKDELIAEFGPGFFTSSPAWMLAYALLLGAKTIGLFGLDMSSRQEYLSQRPGMHHMMWVAQKLYQAEILAPDESDILQPLPLYGYDLNTPRGRKLEVRRKELLSRIGSLDADAQRIARERGLLEGAVDDLDYQQSIWGGERLPETETPVRLAATERKVVNLKTGD